MKIYVGVVGVIVFLVGLGLYTIDRFQGDTTQLLDGIGRTEAAISGSRWDEAAAGIAGVKEVWEKHRRWWALFIEHHEIDNIDMVLTRAEQYIKARERTLAFGELAVLKQMLEQIPESKRVKLKNVF
ncbi:MAG: DUF4363 family protein [Firmicutes bacterium]|nr:DUF4363 family protein [Bacillota bacterium]